MCGIAGWYDRDLDMNDASGILSSMSEAMSCRGPDDSGSYTCGCIGLVHRRLAVIDLVNGHQPMTIREKDKEYTIVYNGELYNTDELRNKLISEGCTFRTRSDTEVVLNTFIKYGSKCCEMFNGIFAFAIWDGEALFLARDRIGVKPLFYCTYRGGIVFASDLNALMQNPMISHTVDENGLAELFLIGPGRTSGQGVYRDVSELLPGQYGIYNGKAISLHKYYTLKAFEHTSDEAATIKEVRELITDSVRRQLVSDVPLFTFLSGGLDSSIITYIAAEHRKENGLPPIDTYSIDYEDNDKYFESSLFQPSPDSEYIGIMQSHTGSCHHSVILDNRELFEALYPAVEARGLPGMTDVDSSLLLFCRRIKEDFTVGLSGECADELFGGYPWYHNKDILFEDCFPWSRSLDIRRSVLKKGFLPRGEEYVRQKYLDTCAAAPKLSTDTPLDKRMREMFALNFNWFMQTLLDRKDRMSMYSGLEVRVPFCDWRIVDYAYNLPWELKALNGREKGIVRAAFRGLLPDSIIDRKKSPYPKTYNPLYFRLCAERVREILNDRTSPLHDILDPEGVENIIQKPERISSPWYGQLMRAPQILAYIIQLDHWFRKYNVSVIRG